MEERILAEWFEACNDWNYESIENLYAEDALVHAKDGDLFGGKAIVRLLQKWVKAIPDLKMTPLHSSTEDDVVVVHWKAEGTLKEDLGEVKATNKQTIFHGLTCFRFKNNKIIEHWVSADYRALAAGR
ncbi:MAG: hypothetical protein S4CHLAM20_06950 [Chlamydiia bacterium]|nr:hypothetical protein [Chlamydiia bacterium]